MSGLRRTGPRRTRWALAALALAAHLCGCEDEVLLIPASFSTEPPEPPPLPEAPAVSAPAASAPTKRSASGEEPDAPPPDIPFVECPVSGDVDGVLDEANRRYLAGDFALAFSCAEAAAERVPQAVEAHHLRAAALAALGRYSDARLAFAMALALDPDDPETLAAAADFYINILPPRRRKTIQVGLEYARRGSERATTRRRLDQSLRARLFLLEAEALNDLGRSDLALPRVEEALELAPSLAEAVHERGVSLFNLCRFRDAEAAFLSVLRDAPNDPYAHHHLGLIYERFGRDRDAEAHFDRARSLAPGEFHPPVLLAREEFREEVDEAVEELPEETRRLLDDVAMELVDLPAVEDLTAVDPPFAPTIMGLYRGLPLGVEQAEPGAREPGRPPDALHAAPRSEDVPARAIVLYRKNLARAVETRRELDGQIRRTLLHEIGHLRGLGESDLRRRGLE